MHRPGSTWRDPSSIATASRVRSTTSTTQYTTPTHRYTLLNTARSSFTSLSFLSISVLPTTYYQRATWRGATTTSSAPTCSSSSSSSPVRPLPPFLPLSPTNSLSRPLLHAPTLAPLPPHLDAPLHPHHLRRRCRSRATQRHLRSDRQHHRGRCALRAGHTVEEGGVEDYAVKEGRV